MIRAMAVLACAACFQEKPSMIWPAECRGGQTRIRAKELHRITRESDWETLWRRHTGDPKADPPKVDFDKSMIVALFFGECGWTGIGHEVKVDFRSFETNDKVSTLTLDVTCSCLKDDDTDCICWMGVFSKRGNDIRINAVVQEFTLGNGIEIHVGTLQ
jgi:hypothetical protein